MKFIFILFIFVFINVSVYAQTDFEFKLINNSINKYSLLDTDNNKAFSTKNRNISFNEDTKNILSCVIINKEGYNKEINLNFNKKSCPGSMMLIFVPLIGIGAGIQSIVSFRNGDVEGGYVALGLSTVLIVVPISYMWYCSNQ